MQIIKIDGEIGWSITAREFKRELEELSGDITIEISSPGGSVYQGVEIFNAIKAYDKGSVTTVITSLAASMASYIALAGDNVKAYDNAVYMIHNASVFSWGDARALRKSALIVESLSKLLAKAYINKTGKSSDEIQKMMDDETYLFGDEILEMGFVDEIITSENSDNDSESARALASESVKACISSYKEHFEKEDKEQIAAVLKECDIKNLATMPSNKEKIANSNKEKSMEYTKEQFEALEKANAKALEDGISDATASERTRVSEIMALAGDSEVKANAIKNGLSVGETAIALNKAFSEKAQKEKVDFEDSAKELEENSQDAEASENINPEAKALEEDDKAYYEARKKGDK